MPTSSIPDRGALDPFRCKTHYHILALSDANFLGGFESRTQASLIEVHLTIPAARPVTTQRPHRMQTFLEVFASPSQASRMGVHLITSAVRPITTQRCLQGRKLSRPYSYFDL